MKLKYRVEFLHILLSGSASLTASEKKMAILKTYQGASGKSSADTSLKYLFLNQYLWCRTVFN